MKRKVMPNGEVVSIRGGLLNPITAPEQGLSPTGRFLVWSGLSMANVDNPKGWQWNPATITSVVTLALVILGMVGAASWFMSQLNSQQLMIIKKLDDVERQASQAKDRADYAAGLRDQINHGGSNTNSQKEK